MNSFLPIALLLFAVTTSRPAELTGKVVCGYQGWFTCPTDGANRGWTHWGSGMDPKRPEKNPGRVGVDLWPDMSELTAAERYPTRFRKADGSAAEVFSSHNEATVLRHFRWMREYGIDGVFLQRFVVDLMTDPVTRAHRDQVLAHCRKGAKAEGRALAVMYDLSGCDTRTVGRTIEDWRELRHSRQLTADADYLRHQDRPLVGVWGIGFNDRGYSLAACRELVEALKADGCSVLLGLPSGWRGLHLDAVQDPELHAILRLADIVSPWTVGRYGDAGGIRDHEHRFLKPDLEWCRKNRLAYLPVVFPGFSWHNLHGGQLNQIPRDRGRFLWSQFLAAKQAGAEMIYVAMFDEVDEGTAIFKCVNDVPVGAGAKFIGYEGLPSDYYLRLTGFGARLLRGEITATPVPPEE